MSQSYGLTEVFTPMTPAVVTFVDRVKEDVNDRLVRALGNVRLSQLVSTKSHLT